MTSMADTILLAVAAVLLVPVGVLFLECIAALLPRRRPEWQANGPRPTVAVLVPAHNEEATVKTVIASVLPQLGRHDRLVVVADNCTDGTAAAAYDAGAIVVERREPHRVGKGYALDFGVRCLGVDPPEVVVVVDADCVAAPGTIDRLARCVGATGRPVQATNLVSQPDNPSSRDLISTLAFMVKNLVRPLGLRRLGLPCLLTGTGMAFPWRTIQAAPLANGSIVEDMQVGTHLAMNGLPAVYCDEARVTGSLPKNGSAAFSQRTRWEHGHLQTLCTQAPRLLAAGLRRRDAGSIALALDVAVPPLSLLAAMLVSATAAALAAGALGCSWRPAEMLIAEDLLLAISVLSAWAVFGRGKLPLAPLLTVPFYILWKIPIYLNFIVRRQKSWVRTERDAAGAAAKD